LELKGKHILIVTPGFAAGENDTTCIPPLYLYVKELKKQNPDIRISIVPIHYPFSEESYLFYGAIVYPQNGRNKKWPFAGNFRKRKFLNQVGELNKLIQFDIIHSFWLGESSCFASSFASINKIPHILTLMGQDAITKSSDARITLHDQGKPEKIITLSAFHKMKFQNFHKNVKSEIIPWGIDEINPSNSERNIDVIGAGNLIGLKNFKRFIEIIRLIREKNPEIKAQIIGKGQQDAELKKEIIKKGLERNIEITGELPRNEVLILMNRSKILLHTSEYESFGYVMAEAMAAGCRVVSTPVGFAYKNDSISTFETNEQATELILQKLSQPVNEKQNIPLMTDTVKSYSEIYRRLVNG